MPRDKRVLVIDKGSELTRVVRQTTEFSSWKLTIATESRKAIEVALKEEPEVIVLGYLEPRGEAFRLHEHLRENPGTGNIPQVVVDVAPAEQPTRGWRKDEGMRMDAECYLCLPLSPQKLGQVIDDILAGAEVLDTI